MHSGWYQSSRMFLRGYTTRVNRLSTLRSSTLTKLAIVSSFTYCFLQKYIFDRRLFQIILFLPLLCIANTKRSSRSFLQFLADTTTSIDEKRHDITPRLFFLLFFIFPSLFLFPQFFLFFLFYFFFFFVSNPLPISRRDTRIPVIYMEKVDGCSWIRAKFVRFCSDFMNVSRRALPPSLPVPDDAVSGEN